MPTFPGTQIANGGVGTFLLMPDGKQLSFSNILRFSISAADINFELAVGSYTYTAPSAYFAQLVLLALRAIPENPASFYVVSQLIPKFAVISITPTTGTAAGGDVVTVTGIGFVDGSVVNFGEIAPDVIYTDPTTISFTTPPNTVGIVVNLIVRNPNGQETLFPDCFTYT